MPDTLVSGSFESFWLLLELGNHWSQGRLRLGVFFPPADVWGGTLLSRQHRVNSIILGCENVAEEGQYIYSSPLLCPPSFFLSKSPLLFWQYFSAINKIQTILRETPLQNPTCNENLMYMMSFTFLLREWCILLNNYYDHNLLLCSRCRRRGTMRSLTIRRHHWRRYFGPFVDEEIFWLKLELPLDTIRQVQRKRMQARQSGRKRKIFRGKRDDDWPLRRTSVVPFG